MWHPLCSVTMLANPADTQRCFKVDFRLWRWTTNFQRWNNVIDFHVGKTTHFQRCFNVRFQHWNNVIFQCWFVWTKSNTFSTLMFDVVSTCICLLGTHIKNVSQDVVKSELWVVQGLTRIRDMWAINILGIFLFFKKKKLRQRFRK